MKQFFMMHVLLVHMIAGYGQGFINHGSVITTTGTSMVTIHGDCVHTDADSGCIRVATAGLHLYVTGDWINHSQSQVFMHTPQTLPCWVHLVGGDQLIAGTKPSHFVHLVIGDSAGTKTLNQQVFIDDTLRMGSGYGTIELHGCTIMIDREGMLVNEHATSYVYESGIDTIGGVIISSALLVAPNQHPMAGLGMTLSTTDTLGITTIVRGHAPRSGSGGFEGIHRWYEVVPQAAGNADVTLALSYFDHELGVHDESLLVPYWSLYEIDWIEQGGVLDPVGQSVTTTAHHQYQFWTLAMQQLDPLSVQILDASATCWATTGERLITWSVLSDAATSYYTLLRSSTMLDWIPVDTLVTELPSVGLQSYQWYDTPPTRDEYYYRLMATDHHGIATVYTQHTVHSVCDAVAVPGIYPNPNRGTYAVQVDYAGTPVPMRVYTAYGVMVYSQTLHAQTTLVQTQLPAGTYWVSIGDTIISMVVY